MKPPTDVPASELWQKLSETPRPTEVIDFPRKDKYGNPVGRVRIQVLRLEDHDQARLVAQQKIKASAARNGVKLEGDDINSPGVREVLGDMTARELLAKACLDERSVTEEPETPFYPRVFPDAEAIGKVLSADEVAVLFNAYLLVQNKYGPYERNLVDDGDVDAWVQRLEGGAAEFPLLHLPLPQLVQLTSLLGDRLSSLYRILGSQWSSLPDTLASALGSYSTAITSFGSLPAAPAEAGSVSLDEAVRLALTLK